MEKHTGTIASIDKSANVIVVEEVGPWRVERGQTEVTKRAIHVSGETKFVRVERRLEAGPGGWPGGFVEASLGAREVREGDYVTVEAERAGERLVALKITVVRL